MTQAAWAPPARPHPLTLAEIGAGGAALGLLLIHSQAWVFPLMGERASPDAGGLIRLLFMPAYLMGAVLLLQSPRDAVKVALRQPFLLALLLIAGLSALWSVEPAPTARRVFALYCTTLGGLGLAARFSWRELSELTAAAFATLAVVALVVSLAVPSIGVMHELFPGAWRGVWPEKNALGGNMTLGFVALCAAAALNPARARLWTGFALLSLFLVLMSTSKTSLVALLVGFGAFVTVALLRRGPVTRLATVWLAVIGVAMAAGVALVASDLFFEVLGKDATLTGRTKIWSAAMRQIELRPWTGFGYGAVWTEQGTWGPLAWIVKDAGFKPQHAHNAWIEQWLGLGVFGLAAFALCWLQTMMLALVAAFRDRGAFLALPFLVVYSLMSLTESVAMTYNDFRWVLFVAVAAKLAWPGGEGPEAAPVRRRGAPSRR